ncbi:unnamed protein product [Parascedosporium putredinis]|uniref:RNA-binding protein n=2 Tax=Parascedosporium putredinis TaxID=1442378 RepID=A0A9P1GWG6_9PEZI|nr:unnamed protein product [Parascedosporium putredinis]CAI7988265.1 unnamed protein product [Parascedosporium putredinis]
MYPHQRGRSPARTRYDDAYDQRRDDSALRDGAYDEQDDYYRSRHGYSRSPPRTSLPYDDLPEGDPRYHDDAGFDRRGRSRDAYDQPRYDDPGPLLQVQTSESELFAVPARHPGSPSDTVILEGLPADIALSEFQSRLLSSSVLSAEEFVDIRMPNSSGARRAFVQFHTVDQAAAFVDRNFPELILKVPDSRDGAESDRMVLYLHFARSRDDGDRRQPPSEQWICPSCDFSNYATRMRCKTCGFAQSSSMGSGYKELLTGETDASNDASQFIVIYPLDPCVTEEVLEFGIKKLEITEKQAPPESQAQSLKYGFAEFWTLEDAAAALGKFRMSRNFTIGGAAVNIFSIHMGVFVPELQHANPEEDKFSFVPLFNPSIRVKYWDTRVFANQRVVNAEPPAAAKSAAEAASNSAEAKKNKKRKADGSLGPQAPKKPVAMAGQMAVWQKKHDELHTDGSMGSGDDRGSANEGPGEPKRHGGRRRSPKPKGAAAPQPEPSLSYVDRDRVCCLLCMMKYKSVDDLDTHERSGNHKRAMEDESKVKAAMPRLAARDKRLREQGKAEGDNEEDKSQYRDRAKERREAFNQPKKPVPQAVKQKPAKAEGSSSSSTPAAPTAPAPSKGSAMLAKMGWAGQGLGANGEGRTDIIVTNAYQEGAGLGAEGANLGDAGELARRRTKNDYGEYLSTAQEKARERYNRLN